MTPVDQGQSESWLADESESVGTTTAYDERGVVDNPPAPSDPQGFPEERVTGRGYEGHGFAEQAGMAAGPSDWHEPRQVVSTSDLSGLNSRSVVATSAAATVACACLDLALTGRMTFFFDLCFVVVCLVATMSVRRTDLFTVGVLPPLLFAAVIAVLSVTTPDAFESGPGVNKVFLSGLANHAPGLVFGYAVALTAVALRMLAAPPDRSGAPPMG